MEELVNARVEVRLWGTQAAIDAANRLLDKSKDFLEILDRNSRRFRSSSMQTAEIEEGRGAQVAAHREFLATIRGEQKSLRKRIG